MLYNEDCLTAVKKIYDESVDLIITDPPFALDYKKKKANYNRLTENLIDGYVDVPADKYREFCLKWIKQAYRVLNKNGAMYVFSGFSHLEDVLYALRISGFYTINQLIWKYNFGVYTKNKYVTSHYNILYVAKKPNGHKFNREAFFADGDVEGSKKLNYADRESVWDIKREYWRGNLKPVTKLPKQIVEKMIKYSSDPYDMVLDLFMGSGQVPFIAKEMHRRYIGIEISREIFEFAQQRIVSGQYFI